MEGVLGASECLPSCCLFPREEGSKGFLLPLLVPRGSTSGASTGDLQPRKTGAFSAFILILSTPWTMERVAEGMLHLNQFL